MDGEGVSHAIAESITKVAALMLAELDEVGDEMDAAEVELSPELGADAAILADASASNRAVVRRFLAVCARSEGTAVSVDVDVPPEALDAARTVARRGIEFDVIIQSYRRGTNVAWRRWLAMAARVLPPGPELVEFLEISSRLVFDYADRVLGRVLEEAHRERERVLGGALARRTETIRLILDGAPIESRRGSERLGYDLSRRHTALVLWAEPPGDVQGALESAATLLARAAGVHRPLTLPAGTSTLWAWLGTDSDLRLGALRDAIADAQPNIRVAVGPTKSGITGFRRSHDGALAVQRMLAGNSDGERLALYHELEVTALAAQDLDRAAEFVATALGPLSADTPSAARLRETLRVFLDEANNAPQAAARLHTHRNTVLQRVARATELLGYSPAERRLALELALELAHYLGPRVLTR
jgi:DNA-binding PucR family transcriptional regulator